MTQGRVCFIGSQIRTRQSRRRGRRRPICSKRRPRHRLPADEHSQTSSAEAGDVDHGLGKGLRRFLRQAVTDTAGNQPVLIGT